MRGNDVSSYGGEEPKHFTYPNGSILYVEGLDKADKLLSGEFDIILGNQVEEFSLDDWEKLTTRATGRAGNAPYSQVVGDCNPSTQNHWILKRKSVKLLPSFHKDNPRLYDVLGALTEAGAKALGILANLTGVRFLRLFKGVWASAEGAVYAEYDANLHLIDHFDPPIDWIRICVIDFGFRNPFVAQWWCIDPLGRMYRYREIYMTNVLVEDHAKHIHRLEKWYYFDDEGNPRTDAQGRVLVNPNREPIYAYIADHDAEDRATLSKHGIETIPAYKAVKLGIEAVQLRLRKATDGLPRLMLMRDSLVAVDTTLAENHKPTCTEEEIESYVWAKNPDGSASKEHPIKIDDHGMDTKRYAVAFVDGIGQELEEHQEVLVFNETFTISPV